ncbi:MAG: 2'-5' RNA ligase family protein, partial [Thaumarchaeota archaeon]|nr:2'-5' RNA ligase family protein [Nitrososphaerota archaeon]
TPISEYWNQILNAGETNYAGLIYRIPPRLWRALILAQNELKRVDERQLYASPSTFHVPIKGLGYLAEDMDRNEYEILLSKVKEILSNVDPFEIKIHGLSAFPTAIFAKIEDGGNFKKLNKMIAEELRGRVDKSPFDDEEFVPHVNLATFVTKDVEPLLEKMDAQEFKERDFGMAGVFEIEAVRINLILALGPQETQDNAFSYIRSFWLGKFTG